MIAPRKTPNSGMPGALVERVLVGVADRLQEVVGLLGAEAADDDAREVVGDRDEETGRRDRDSGEDERHRQVAERGADEHPDVLADHRLDHREHEHQERERSGDGDHGAVLPLEPARREVGAGRALDELADLAGHPDGGIRHPHGDAAHDELAGRRTRPCLTAPATASQTLPTTGSSHGFGIGPTSARAGAANGPASDDRAERAASAPH